VACAELGALLTGATKSCQARFALAALAITARRSASGTSEMVAESSALSVTGGGTMRVERRSGGRSGESSGPTRKHSWSTACPRTRSRATSSGASIWSSFAQTLVVTFTSRMPRSSVTGCARSAMRGPTASFHSRIGIGGRLRAKRSSPARSSRSIIGSGASRCLRLRRFEDLAIGADGSIGSGPSMERAPS